MAVRSPSGPRSSARARATASRTASTGGSGGPDDGHARPASTAIGAASVPVTGSWLGCGSVPGWPRRGGRGDSATADAPRGSPAGRGPPGSPRAHRRPAATRPPRSRGWRAHPRRARLRRPRGARRWRRRARAGHGADLGGGRRQRLPATAAPRHPRSWPVAGARAAWPRRRRRRARSVGPCRSASIRGAPVASAPVSHRAVSAPLSTSTQAISPAAAAPDRSEQRPHDAGAARARRDPRRWPRPGGPRTPSPRAASSTPGGWRRGRRCRPPPPPPTTRAGRWPRRGR